MAAVGSQHCPHCGFTPDFARAFPFGAVDCDSCGRRVWFLTVCGARLFFRYEEAQLVRELFRRAIDHQEFDESLNADSLDKVELVMEFEDELERTA